MVFKRKGESSENTESDVFEVFTRMNSGNVTEQDRRFFDDWQKKHPQRIRQYEEIESLWGEIGVYTAEMEANEHVAISSDESGHAQKSRHISWLSTKTMAIAASFLLLIGVAINSLLSFDPIDQYQTKMGERLAVTLADGSTVHLNSKTEIEVHFTAKERNIRLLQGEALFEVAHQPERKFLVSTKYGTARAIGTTFDVDIASKQLKVIVVEGVVAVTPPEVEAVNLKEQLTIATKGEQVIIDQQGDISTNSDRNVEHLTAWTRGKLIFSGESLQQVVAKANLYTPKSIAVQDKRLTDLPVFGVFNIGDTDGLIQALESNFPIKALEISDTVTLLSFNSANTGTEN